jgi:hypothetical protein
VLRIRAVGVDLRFGSHRNDFRLNWSRRANGVFEIFEVSD